MKANFRLNNLGKKMKDPEEEKYITFEQVLSFGWTANGPGHQLVRENNEDFVT